MKFWTCGLIAIVVFSAVTGLGFHDSAYGMYAKTKDPAAMESASLWFATIGSFFISFLFLNGLSRLVFYTSVFLNCYLAFLITRFSYLPFDGFVEQLMQLGSTALLRLSNILA